MDTPEPAKPAPEPRPPGEARRAMLRTLLWGGGVAGIGALAGVGLSRRLAGGRADAASGPKPTRPPLGPEFTYDVTRFQKTDPELVRFREVGRFASGMSRPRALAVGAGGVWVGGATGVRRFSEAGELLAETATAQPVTALAVMADGGLLVGHQGGIRVLDKSGAEVAQWTDLGPKFLPTAIALAGDDAVFVADAGGRVVLKLDDKGAKLLEIDGRNGGPGFMVPSPYFCLRMAPDGLLRVANPGEHRVEAYTAEGKMELAWGTSGFAIAGFSGCCNPVSFEVLADGSFVTCEKGLPRVKWYDSHGDFAGVVAGPETFPEYLAAANSGTLDTGYAGLYAAAGAGGRVLVLDSVGGAVRVMEPLAREAAP